MIQKGLGASKARGLVIEERKIKRLEAVGDVSVNVVLEDGEAVYMGFLVHKPVTTLVTEDLVIDPGIETAIPNVVTAIAHGMIWSFDWCYEIELIAVTTGSIAAATIA